MADRKLTIYIAGPITGQDGYNHEAFYRAEIDWKQKGWAVINHIELDEGFFEGEWLSYILRDLPYVEKADAIAMLPGWETSSGARIERLVAEKLNKRVYESRAVIPPATHKFIEGENVCCNLPDFCHIGFEQ
jgi:hypothetical protein